MKKEFLFILIGVVIFIIGFITFGLETSNFSESTRLSSDIIMKQEILSYNINEDKFFRITNSNSNTNVNLYIDNNLSDEIRIVVNYPEFNSVEYDYDVISNEKVKLVQIDFESSTTLSKIDDLINIFQVGVNGFKNKVKYNYSLIENPEVKVYVHEDYKENIQFVGKYGQVYNPIR